MDKRQRTDYNNQGQFVQLKQRNNNSNAQSTDIFEFASIILQQESNTVRDRVNQILHGKNDSSIPSPLPATLNRRDLPRFLRDKSRYRICEKSDGERALMYVNKNGAYLINRKFHIQKINQDICNLYTNLVVNDTDELLLDGEIIENYFNPEEDKFESEEEANKSYQQNIFYPPQLRKAVQTAGNVDAYLATQITQKRFVYCMFDVAYFDQKDMQELPLDGRLGLCGKLKQRIREYLLPVLKEKFPVSDFPQLKTDDDYFQFYIWNHATLRIETKDFQHAPDMRRILRTVIRFPQDQGYLYYNLHKQLKSKNDGFIFTPMDNNYMMASNPDQYIYKYKWPGLNTVDFRIQAPYFDEKQQLVLYSHAHDTSGTRKVEFDFAHISLTPENKEYVLSHIENVNQAVVECNYDARDGRWLIKHLRTDKHTGNFFSTVLSCLEAMIDNLKPEELESMLKKV